MQGIATEAATEEKPAAQKDSVPKVIYHVAQKDLWQAALNCSKPYYPPTYEADGFIHATADPNLLLGKYYVVNLPSSNSNKRCIE